MKVYAPQINVRLVKRIGRDRQGFSQRFQDASGTIVDLTPFLGEGSQVVVDKNIRQPDGGSFSISLLDKPDTSIRGINDTLYGLVEPMDYVEIRMAREAWKYGGSPFNMPVLMRGFVTTVRRVESMSEDGHPRRNVVITGHDYGKILKAIQIFLRADYIDGNDYLTAFRLFARTMEFGQIMTPAAFMAACVGLANGWLQRMEAITDLGGLVPLLGFDQTLAPQAGFISPLSMQLFEGTLFDLMNSWADTPWNELWVDDLASGPSVVYRPSPYLDINDQPIFNGSQTPYCLDAVTNQPLQIDDSDMPVIEVARDDCDVANYFWVEPNISTLNTQDLLNVQALANGDNTVRDEPNCDPDLYGLRLMNTRTMQFGSPQDGPQDATSEAVLGFAKGVKDWVGTRRAQLKAMNVDNVLFEKGSIDLKGNEQIRAGRYLLVQRGALNYKFYIAGARHVFAPFRMYRTSLTVERGTGFQQRVQLQRNPAFAEGARGVY